ncbi:hypothetical protein ACT29H_09460 [Thermophagus sp. OGC60D27]|uniref:hypothetical protein n=1 Tax=Thermophagus sp. OGC60D27 TaxID=3458415 RepID=UPI004037A455
MKHLFLILFLVMMGSTAFSQFKELPDVQYEKHGVSYTVNGEYSTQQLAAQLAHTNFCINKFHRLRKASRIVGYTGFSLVLIGLSMEEDTGVFLSGVGGAFGFISWTLSLSAEKWLKRASIKPTQYGATFVFEF